MVNTSVINIELVEVINGHVVKSQQCNLNIIEYPKNFRGSLSTTSLVQRSFMEPVHAQRHIGLLEQRAFPSEPAYSLHGLSVFGTKTQVVPKGFSFEYFIGLKVARKRCTL
jgi:hypothetical protein